MYGPRLLGAVIAATTTIAHANGRPPATSTIQFRVGHDRDVLVGLTFGVAVSHDGGASWQWMCEATVGYGGTYDPHYLWFPSGALFATTTNGLHVSRDGCTFAQTSALGAEYVSAIARGPDNALYVAMADPTDSKIYKSTDEGVTFPQSAIPGVINTWWQTIVVATSDPNRVYLSGWLMTSSPPRTHLLFRSLNGGQSFAALPTSSLTPISDNSTIDVIGVSPTNPDLVFVRVTGETGGAGDAIYRSTDGAQSFTKVLAVADSLVGFALRGNGDIVVASPNLGMYKSIDGGTSFQPIATSPTIHSHCLAENEAGVLWDCTDNYSGEMMGAAISTDGVTWTNTFRYQDIAQPIACAAGTTQLDVCQTLNWCGLRAQLGIVADPTSCPTADGIATPKSKGCCDASGSTSSLALGAVIVVLRRRRTPSTGCRI